MRDYSPRRRTAVVLAGSGTSGAYHAGVLKALDESGVKVDLAVGSGVGAENIGLYPEADAFIVGSALKEGGTWSGALDPVRVRALSQAFAALPRG